MKSSKLRWLAGVDDFTVVKETEAARLVELGHVCSLKQKEIFLFLLQYKPGSHEGRKMKGWPY